MLGMRLRQLATVVLPVVLTAGLLAAGAGPLQPALGWLAGHVNDGAEHETGQRAAEGSGPGACRVAARRGDLSDADTYVKNGCHVNARDDRTRLWGFSVDARIYAKAGTPCQDDVDEGHNGACLAWNSNRRDAQPVTGIGERAFRYVTSEFLLLSTVDGNLLLQIQCVPTGLADPQDPVRGSTCNVISEDFTRAVLRGLREETSSSSPGPRSYRPILLLRMW